MTIPKSKRKKKITKKKKHIKPNCSVDSFKASSEPLLPSYAYSSSSYASSSSLSLHRRFGRVIGKGCGWMANGISRSVQFAAQTVESTVYYSLVLPVCWTSSCLVSLCLAPFRMGGKIVKGVASLASPSSLSAQSNSSLRISKLEKRIRNLEHDVRRLKRQRKEHFTDDEDRESDEREEVEAAEDGEGKRENEASVLDSELVASSRSTKKEAISKCAPPPPPPPPPPPVVSAPHPYFLRRNSSSSSNSTQQQQTKKENQSFAITQRELRDVKLRKVSNLNNGINNNSKKNNCSSLQQRLFTQKPLSDISNKLQQQIQANSSSFKPPSPSRINSQLLCLRKINKSPGGTPIKQQHQKQFSTVTDLPLQHQQYQQQLVNSPPFAIPALRKQKVISR